MLSSPRSVTPACARIRRVLTPACLVAALFAGTAVATLPARTASAATVGTFTIGSRPVVLNQPSDPEMGAITPAADAAENGMFGSVLPMPVIPIHAMLTRTGHLVTFGTPVGKVAFMGDDFDDWNPAAGSGEAAHIGTPAENLYDSFCNGATTLPDGRILMASGNHNDTASSEIMTMIYDPVTKEQTLGGQLHYRRWYVTALRLTDGRVLLVGGGGSGYANAYEKPDDNTLIATTPEIGSGTGAWTTLGGAESAELFGAANNRWWYPRAFNAPDGSVVGFSGDRVWSLDPNGQGSVRQTGTLPFDPRVSGSQVMYAPGKILIAGGGQTSNEQANAPATDKAVVLDVEGAEPTTSMTSPMHAPRNWLNLTVLPTGEVLANGGTRVSLEIEGDGAVQQAELWNPRTGTWSTAATAQRVRTYHSTSLVLPSGAVFTGGGGSPGPVSNFDAELYYPASLFTKDGMGVTRWASRPTITALSGSATYGGDVALKMGDSRSIASASLITLPSVTHGQNTDQRRVPLAIRQKGDTVTATLPDSVNTLPPGDYELTVVDAKGVPSPAQIVSIRANAPGLVTVAEVAGQSGHHAAAPVDGAPHDHAPAKGAKTLAKGSAIGFESVQKHGYRITHAKAAVSLAKVGATSRKAVKRAASWIVRTGLGSKRGYSFESIDRRGWYLAAPADGSGRVTLVKRPTSKSSAARVTFTVVEGLTGRDSAIQLTARPGSYLRIDGSRLATGKVGESTRSARSATFAVGKGLSKK